MTERLHVQVLGRDGWCVAPHKKTTRYQENVAIACGGFLVLPWELRITSDRPTCEDCRAGRKRAS